MLGYDFELLIKSFGTMPKADIKVKLLEVLNKALEMTVIESGFDKAIDNLGRAEAAVRQLIELGMKEDKANAIIEDYMAGLEIEYKEL